jgi:plastocyanin
VKTAFAIAALAVALAGPGRAPAHDDHAPRAHRASVAVGVAEREWHISSYRAKVKPGTIRFNVTNFGEDSHNLQIAGPGGYRSPVSPDLRSHERYTLTVTLRKQGVYRLLCTKPGHIKNGMRASIRVRR